MKLKEIIEKSTLFLKQKGLETPRLDSEFLISNALNMRRMDLYLQFDRPLKESEVEKSREFVVRRGKHEPVAYITGEKDFYKSTFSVGPGVLIPRPETELLVEHCTHWLQRNFETNKEVVGLDLGSGTGCIPISICLEFENINFCVVEKSQAAFGYLVSNIERHHLQKRISAYNMTAEDFAKQNKKEFDIVVANPPYIDPKDTNIQSDVKIFEPSDALFAENNGLALIESWSGLFAKFLNRNQSLMMFEIGWQQGHQAEAKFKSLNEFNSVEVLKDYSKHDRFVIGEKKNG